MPVSGRRGGSDRVDLGAFGRSVALGAFGRSVALGAFGRSVARGLLDAARQLAQDDVRA
jgi:hypothetical protein